VVDALKNLLLFFEGTAILLPRYMSGCEPSLTGPLAEKGLVRVLESETFVDQEMTESLAPRSRNWYSAASVSACRRNPAHSRASALTKVRSGTWVTCGDRRQIHDPP
jgi:hypothetical protein